MDDSIGALWESATDKFGFGAVVETASECGRRRTIRLLEDRTQRLWESADWELQIGLDGRSVPDQRNERIDAPCVVGASV